MPEREILLDYRLRWLGLLPLACWTFQAIYNVFVQMRPGALWWMCHVTTLLLAVGLLFSFASLIRLVAAWTLLGLPIWLVDVMAVGTTRISVLSHLVVPIVAVIALSQVGVGPSRWRMTLGSVGLLVGLQFICRVGTHPQLNVNLAHKIYPFLGASVVDSYPVYWVISSAMAALALHAIHIGLARRFPPPPLAALVDSRVVAVGGDSDALTTTAAKPAPAPPKKRSASTIVRGKPAGSLTRQVLADDAPVEASEPKLRAPGFTLLEVMVVVGILAVLAAIAVPDLSPAIHNAKLRSSADEVVNFLERARRNARAEGRCYRVRTVGTDALAMDRRDHADCVTDAILADGWTEVAVSSVPGAGFRYFIETLPTDAPPAARHIIFRPNGRLRGDADTNVEDDGARVYIEYNRMGSIGFDVVVTSFGRLCAQRVPDRPAPLTAGPVVCGFGFLAGGVALDGGSAPPPPAPPAPPPGPGPAPPPGPGPAPPPGPGPAPPPGPGPAPPPPPAPPPAPAFGFGGGSSC